jgi:hypothetical protein
MHSSPTVSPWSHGSPMRPPVSGLTHLTPLIGVRVRPLGETNGANQTPRRPTPFGYTARYSRQGSACGPQAGRMRGD